uniref:Mucin-like domain-containing protein n=1 Tax=Anopheles dirus TaxID=7168 RepID=A0A182N4V1_9DIPT
MAVKLVASLLLLLAVAVLASKEPTSKPVDSVAIATTAKTQHSQPSKAPAAVGQKAPHGKREIGSYGLPPPVHHRYSLGHANPLAEFYAPATSHGSYSYSIPQHGSFGAHKLFYGANSQSSIPSSLKYTPSSLASSHAFFAPLGLQSVHHGAFGGFPEVGHTKYASFGTKDLSELLKQLHSVGPLTIKAIPSSYAYGAFGHEHEQTSHNSPSVLYDSGAFHLKPMPLKLHEVPSFTHGSSLPHAAALTAPAGPTSTSSTYGHVAHTLGYEPSYASGLKGLRHYSSSNVPANDLYSGNKYVSALNVNHQPTTATMVSPLHTSVHSTVGHQKPFKPSTYLGSTHETISAPSTSHTGSYLPPSLQYLPPVGKGSPFPHKVSYDSPAKHGYLPPAPPSTNAYLPPLSKPAHGYLPPVSSAGSNYIPLSSSSAPASAGSHEDIVRKPSQHPQQHPEHSGESLEYSGASSAGAPAPTAVTPGHHWKH